MSREDVDRLPLIERFSQSDHLARELQEHLQQGFLPKLRQLRHAAKERDTKTVTDQAVRDGMEKLLASDDFANELYGRLRTYLISIEEATRHLVYGAEEAEDDEDLDLHLKLEEEQDDDFEF